MNMASNDPALKFNKIFLKLYSNPIATNFIKTIHIYKGLGELKTAIINELQDFIHHEYEISNISVDDDSFKKLKIGQKSILVIIDDTGLKYKYWFYSYR